MKQANQSLRPFEPLPSSIERSVPRNVILGDIPSVLLIKVHEDGCWVVASRLASDVMANPNSHLGSFMRTHCALLALRHVSNN